MGNSSSSTSAGRRAKSLPQIRRANAYDSATGRENPPSTSFESRYDVRLLVSERSPYRGSSSEQKTSAMASTAAMDYKEVSLGD